MKGVMIMKEGTVSLNNVEKAINNSIQVLSKTELVLPLISLNYMNSDNKNATEIGGV